MTKSNGVRVTVPKPGMEVDVAIERHPQVDRIYYGPLTIDIHDPDNPDPKAKFRVSQKNILSKNPTTHTWVFGKVGDVYLYLAGDQLIMTKNDNLNP